MLVRILALTALFCLTQPTNFTAQTATLPAGVPCTVQTVGTYADKDAKLTVRCNTNGDPVMLKDNAFSIADQWWRWIRPKPVVVVPPVGGGPTYTAASCSRTDVDAVINGPTHTAVNGDTIQIPGTSCTWTSQVTIPSGIGITIKGTGTPTSSSAVVGTAGSAACENTVITHSNTGGHLFAAQPTMSSSTVRISCMKILAGAVSNDTLFAPLAFGGTCTIAGCPNIRVDNVTFGAFGLKLDARGGYSVIETDNVFGVIDHTTLGNQTSNTFMLNFGHSAWLGVGDFGDKSWAEPSSFGSPNAIYIENSLLGDNTSFTESESILWNMITGRTCGGRVVARFNTSTGAISGMANHGTDSSGRCRGGRQGEFYGNTVTCINGSGCPGLVPVRSGVYMVFGNTAIKGAGSWFSSFLSLGIFRIDVTWASPFNQCPGSYDQASPLLCLDQPSRSGGTLLSGNPPTTGWSGQALDPSYEWKNTGDASGSNPVGTGVGTSYVAYLQANRDWYSEAAAGVPVAQSSASSPFNGTSGVGFGTKVSPNYRPATCTTGTTGRGVAYWATDEGNWNTSGNAFGNGNLYICTATNTWSLSYTPYSYPHPLVTP